MLWARSARRDLDRLVAYLADHDRKAAGVALERLEGKARSLATLAERGRVVPELARLHVREYRELLVPPYRLLYRTRGAEVVVLAIYDGRRSLEDVLLDRLIRDEEDGD